MFRVLGESEGGGHFFVSEVPLQTESEPFAVVLCRHFSKRCFPRKRQRAPERYFFIDDLVVQIYFIIVMIRWTGLAP